MRKVSVGSEMVALIECFMRCISTMYDRMMAGYRRAPGGGQTRCEEVMDQLDSRLVHLELQDRKCLREARRHHAAKTRTMFRSKMLEHRRIQTQIAQLQRFRENASAQFDALSNHELNRTFIQTMQGLVAGASKGRVVAAREDAENVMEDFQESVAQVKELSEFLGQPVTSSVGMDDVTDEDLESELYMDQEEELEEERNVVSVDERRRSRTENIELSEERSRYNQVGISSAGSSRGSLEDMLVVPTALMAR